MTSVRLEWNLEAPTVPRPPAPHPPSGEHHANLGPSLRATKPNAGSRDGPWDNQWTTRTDTP